MPSTTCQICGACGALLSSDANGSLSVSSLEQLNGLQCLDSAATDAIGEVLGACAVGATLTLRTIFGSAGTPLRLAASLESFTGACYVSVAHESLGPLLVALARRWKLDRS
jgi:hypothetical protein